jgi:hypothetical protein
MTSVRIADLRAEILTRDLPITKQEVLIILPRLSVREQEKIRVTCRKLRNEEFRNLCCKESILGQQNQGWSREAEYEER